MPTERPQPDPAPSEPAPRSPAPEPSVPDGSSTVDQMSESSFPASDPPAVWTWDVPARA